MSFKCVICGKPQPVGTKPIKMPTRVRMFVLEPVQKEDPQIKLIVVSSRERYETVKEGEVCPSCSKKNIHPEVVDVVVS